LRGLGANHSLLLVDGLRVADYPLPSTGRLQSIHLPEFQQPAGRNGRSIEVLGTGASSIYGSDAVAGVVNVILKHDYVGDTVSVRGGGAVRGGRDLTDITWMVAKASAICTSSTTFSTSTAARCGAITARTPTPMRAPLRHVVSRGPAVWLPALLGPVS